jgi:hypothetical protein
VESKRGRIRRVKYWRTSLAILAALFASIALADDFKTINGKEYKNATVSRVEADGIVLRTKSGITKVYFSELPKEVQERFGYDTAVVKAAEGKRIEAQNAAERERAERETNADADLKHALEQFQSAEQHAAQTYQSAPKGTLSGQVFVSSRGGEKFVIEIPQTGKFVIAARAQRSLGGYTEHYYWLQPVSLEGQSQLTQNFSNNNLTSATGTSSLIHTEE